MEQRGRHMFQFLLNDNVLDAMESLLGSEITCNPIQHLRAKPPLSCSPDGRDLDSVPWHQDSGVTWVEADDSEIITCWIALADATIEKGCMQVLPGVWKNGYLEHQKEGGTTIRPDLLPNATPRPVPVRKGGAVIMHRCTPHKSTANLSDKVRWSLDLRYQPTGVPTGRPVHPEFVARSRSNPESVLTDHGEWSRRWAEALEKSKGIKMHRV
jgi:ectoine hydroxylase-related dioxygenase (phytanoyl-CoA dioxygenase family)